MIITKSQLLVLTILISSVICAERDFDDLYSFSAVNERRSAKHLTKPIFLDPRKTWASFLRNNEKTDREHNKKRKKFQRRCERMWRNKVCSCKT